jgi:hypothetical protein
MGFWDAVGKAAASAGKAAVDSARDGLEKQRQFKDLYAEKSDSELFSILVNAMRRKQYAEGSAVRGLLKSRGYSEDDISSRVRAIF